MPAIDDLNAKFDKLTSDLSAKFTDLSTEIAGLKAAGGATPDQLTALGSKVDALDASVTAFTA